MLRNDARKCVDLPSLVSEEVERIGINDLMLLIAAFTDEDAWGAVTPPDRDLVRSGLLGVLAEFYGRRIAVAPDAHKAFRRCLDRLA